MLESIVDSSRRYKAEQGWRLLGEFVQLLTLDNVTGDHAALRKNAQAITDLFASRGVMLETVEAPGAAPILVGRLGDDASRPTIGLYVHYDGQPTGSGTWHNPPFQPTLRDDALRAIALPRAGESIDDNIRVFARAAADDKAPLVALAGALDVVRATGLELAVNLVFCFEGEEEQGSPNLRAYLNALRDKLRADTWLILDGPVHHTGAPQIVLGVRGFCGFELTVYGPLTELHSGHYGNWAPNPALELARLLASFKDDTGRVTVDGFYDSSVPTTPAESALIDALPEVEAGLLDRLGIAQAEATGSRLADRIMLPSFNIRGLAAADVGDSARNVIPSEATASVDIRLVPGNDSLSMLQAVRKHVERQGFYVVTEAPTLQQRRMHARLARFVPQPGYAAMRASAELPMIGHLAMIAGAAAGRPAFVVPTLGGSVPLHHLTEVLGVPALILPIANADNNQHAANENLRIGHLFDAVTLFTLLLTSAP